MLRDETAKLLMMIQGAYPNYKPDNKTVTVNTWFLALSDIPFGLAEKAFLAYLRADTKGFAPTPGQLIAFVSKWHLLTLCDLTGTKPKDRRNMKSYRLICNK